MGLVLRALQKLFYFRHSPDLGPGAMFHVERWLRQGRLRTDLVCSLFHVEHGGGTGAVMRARALVPMPIGCQFDTPAPSPRYDLPPYLITNNLWTAPYHGPYLVHTLHTGLLPGTKKQTSRACDPTTFSTWNLDSL